MNKLEIIRSSNVITDEFLAEVWINDQNWADVGEKEEGKSELLVRFYPHPENEVWELGYEEALNFLAAAKRRLLGEDVS